MHEKRSATKTRCSPHTHMSHKGGDTVQNSSPECIAWFHALNRSSYGNLLAVKCTTRERGGAISAENNPAIKHPVHVFASLYTANDSTRGKKTDTRIQWIVNFQVVRAGHHCTIAIDRRYNEHHHFRHVKCHTIKHHNCNTYTALQVVSNEMNIITFVTLIRIIIGTLTWCRLSSLSKLPLSNIHLLLMWEILYVSITITVIFSHFTICT